VVAMVFLPVMKIGGMQFFRSEGFDTLGKILPRAGQIAAEMTRLYLFLTAACIVTYLLLGMTGFDAVMHAFSTVSTGGFSNYDASFGRYLGAPEWAASVFMILASIPFIRMVQAMRGNFVPFWRDVQIRAYLRWIFYACAIIVVYRLLYVQQDARPAEVIRETVFNTISTFSGTGFSSTDITQWGHLPFAILIVCGRHELHGWQPSVADLAYGKIFLSSGVRVVLNCFLRHRIVPNKPIGVGQIRSFLPTGSFHFLSGRTGIAIAR